VGFRADLGIIDDPTGSRGDTFSEIARNRIWDCFLNDFSARLTRGHQDNLARRILEEAKRTRQMRL
jgi:hypothetical protein